MQIEVFADKQGSAPLSTFLNNIKRDKPKLAAKVIREIEMLETFGRDLREPSSKFIGDGIFELRANIGKDAARVFYMLDGDKAVLLNAYVKKTSKAPRAEIAKAKKYQADYIAGKEGR